MKGPASHIRLSRGLLELFSPATLAIPYLRSHDELRLLEKLWRRAPSVSADGWGARFGRELNATDDRDILHMDPTGLPVLEGKHVDPFCVHVERATRFVALEEARRRLPAEPFARARLAYRDVASATNERTLIAAVVPAAVVTTHTLFCCRTAMDDTSQYALCALLNSLVANWLVRRWVSTHVTVALLERLPVPSPTELGAMLKTLAHEAIQLAGCSSHASRLASEARVHAWAAEAWGLNREELQLILSDFPRLEAALCRAILHEFGVPRLHSSPE
jgi:hypothetical protein